MKVAITAANGRLGRTIIRAAIPVFSKENVIGIARTPERASDLGIEIRKGDYNHQEDFNQAFRGVDTALLISGMDLPDKRIVQHRNVICGAQHAGVRKIIYTSIFGVPGNSGFDGIIKSNRQTEEDVKASGLEWIIGRNGLYIDEDLQAIPEYIKDKKIANCAANGKCAYTSRDELGAAYSTLMVDDRKNGRIYNLCGDTITQQQLTDCINEVYHLSLSYESMSIEDYLNNRIAAHGEFLGVVIAGIYTGIRNGAFDIPSDYEKAAGRPHKNLKKIIEEYACVS